MKNCCFLPAKSMILKLVFGGKFTSNQFYSRLAKRLLGTKRDFSLVRNPREKVPQMMSQSRLEIKQYLGPKSWLKVLVFCFAIWPKDDTWKRTPTLSMASKVLEGDLAKILLGTRVELAHQGVLKRDHPFDSVNGFESFWGDPLKCSVGCQGLHLTPYNCEKSKQNQRWP